MFEKRQFFIFMIEAAVLLLLTGGAYGATLTVDDSGGADFTKIQDAINYSNDGDTIIVYSGTYYENVNVSKRLALIGMDNGGGAPEIYAGGNTGIKITAGRAALEGFSVRNASYGIYIISNDNLLRNNNASNNKYGIFLYSSMNNTLSGNIANNNRGSIYTSMYSSGIYMWLSRNNTLVNNTVSNNNYGIFLTDYSRNNTIIGNNASNNGGGIYLKSSNGNVLASNTVNSNGACGIYLWLSGSNTLTANNAISNIYGVCLTSSSDNLIAENNASSNSYYGFYLFYISRNNNLIDNTARDNAHWDFYSSVNATNNRIINFTIGPAISFMGKDISIGSVKFPPVSPPGIRNIGKYVNITNNSADSWLFLNISYSDSDVADMDESSLRMWRYNGSWSKLPPPNGVDTVRNYVYANITRFSVFAPMAGDII